MNGRLQFDDRLLNRYAVEELSQSHPALHAALEAWFGAFGDFDDTSIDRLLAARGPEVNQWQAKAELALQSIPAIVRTLDAVMMELKAALSAQATFPERAQLEGLLESAQLNRAMLAEQAPALVAGALGSAGTYDSAKAGAPAAVERAAEQLERMRARSEDAALAYRELQPLADGLKATWRDLDQALAPLSRPDRQAVRGPHEKRMRKAAAALCRNLFARKMRDRATGDWPMPAIPLPGPSVVEQFSAALAGGDFAAAHSMLAPWLAAEWDATRLAQEMARSARDIADASGLTTPPPAGAYRVGSNPLNYEGARRDRGTLPAEVTAANYKGWFSIQIQPEEEDSDLTDVDSLASLHAVAVSTASGERIGYLRFEEP